MAKLSNFPNSLMYMFASGLYKHRHPFPIPSNIFILIH